MTDAYTEIMEKIDLLSKEAERVRKVELSSVIKKIKSQIKLYEISAEELGFESKGQSEPTETGTSKTKKLVSRRKVSRSSVPKKYQDGKGNFWTGRGKKPLWVTEALTAGRSLEDLPIK